MLVLVEEPFFSRNSLKLQTVCSLNTLKEIVVEDMKMSQPFLSDRKCQKLIRKNEYQLEIENSARVNCKLYVR